MSDEDKKDQETDFEVDTSAGPQQVTAPAAQSPVAAETPAVAPAPAPASQGQDLDEESPEDVDQQEKEVFPKIPPKPQETHGASNVVNVVGNLPPAQDAMQKTAEAIAFADDLDNGHIHPMTYSQWFHNKDTMGRLGTMFGLLMSGAGSGLSHQSNAVMDMMNNEIRNDLERQKTDQTNKQNWYKLANDHLMTNANIETQNAAAAAQRMGTYDKALDTQLKSYNINQLPGLVRNGADASSYAAMQAANLATAQARVNQMTPGATKNHAQQVIDNVMKPNFLQQTGQAAQKAAAQNAILQSQNPHPLKGADQPADPRGPAVDENKMKQMMLQSNIGNINPDMTITPAEAQAIAGERQRMQANRNAYADYLDNVREMDKLSFAGQLPGGGALGSALRGAGTAVGGVLGTIAGGVLGTAAGAGAGAAVGNAASHAAANAQNAFEQKRAALSEGLKQRMGKDMSEDDKQKLVDSMLPTWYDSEDTKALKGRVAHQHFMSNANEMAPISELKGIKIPFTKETYVPTKTEKETKRPREMETTTATEGE